MLIPKQPPASQHTKHLGDHLTTPILMALVPVVSVLFGWALDRVLGTFPWLTLTLLGLGFIAVAREVWMKARR